MKCVATGRDSRQRCTRGGANPARAAATDAHLPCPPTNSKHSNKHRSQWLTILDDRTTIDLEMSSTEAGSTQIVAQLSSACQAWSPLNTTRMLMAGICSEIKIVNSQKKKFGTPPFGEILVDGVTQHTTQVLPNTLEPEWTEEIQLSVHHLY
jgi:hypothetical protein